VIERPDSVRRVMPPTTTMPNTSAADPNSHRDTAWSCGSLEAESCCSSCCCCCCVDSLADTVVVACVLRKRRTGAAPADQRGNCGVRTLRSNGTAERFTDNVAAVAVKRSKERLIVRNFDFECMSEYFENSDAVLVVPANPHNLVLRSGDSLDVASVPTRTYLIQGELLRVLVVLTASASLVSSAPDLAARLEPTSMSLFEQLQFDVFLVADSSPKPALTAAPANGVARSPLRSTSGDLLAASASSSGASTPSRSASTAGALSVSAAASLMKLKEPASLGSSVSDGDSEDSVPPRVASRDFGKLMKRLKRVKQEVDPAHDFEHSARALAAAAAGAGDANSSNAQSSNDDETNYVLDGAPIRLANGDLAFALRVPINVEHEYVGQKLQLVVAVERKAPFSVRSAPDVFSSQLTFDALLHPKYNDPSMSVLIGSTKPIELLEPLALSVQAEPFDAGSERLLYVVTARVAAHSPPMVVEKLNVLIESARFAARIVNDQPALVTLQPGDEYAFLVEVLPTAVQRVRRNVGVTVPPSTEEATFMLFWCADVVWRRAASFVRWRLPPPGASPITVRVVMPDTAPRVQHAFAVEFVLTNSAEIDVGVVCELPDGVAVSGGAGQAPLVCLDKTLIYERIAPGASMAQVAHFVAMNRGLFRVGELTLRVTALGADSSGAVGGLWAVDSGDAERSLTTIAVD
jgi:hypothetical protein